jgi:hypothetical protein
MVPLVIDTGASITVTPYSTDFISPIQPVQSVEIKGIASGLQVRGFGDVCYKFYNDAGELQTLTLPNCLYVPQCTARLLCPRQIGATSGHPGDGFNATSDNPILTFEGKQTTIQYDNISNLPILYTAPGVTSFHRYCAKQGYLNKLSDKNLSEDASPTFLYRNLTPSQQRKLHLHERCAHAHWDQINSWIRNGSLPCDKSLASVPDPVCATCQFGKAHKRSHKTDTGHIGRQHQAPGDGVSSDGMEAGCPGKMLTTHGLPSTRRLKYCSFWIDHYSQFVYVTMHESKRAEELLRSKLEFEEYAARYGVNIKNIRADNGVYTAKVIKDSCLKRQQNLTFCAVGAHWQNGIAERFIGSIVQRARTILLHAMAKWPETVTEDMWSFAIRHMVHFHNASIRRDKQQSPHQLFTGEEPPWKLKDFRVFGCPTYVLHKRLQDGDAFSKWKARSWLGVYIGPSSCHASNIPLIYNPATTHVTPQFHVVNDEGFTSITSFASDIKDKLLDKLYEKAFWSQQHEGDLTIPATYHFDSFWTGSHDVNNTTYKGRKRLIPLPINNPNITLNDPETVSALEGDHPVALPSGAVSASEGASALPVQAVSATDTQLINSNSTPLAVSATEGVLDMAVSASNTPMAQHSIPSNDTATNIDRPKYAIYYGTSSYQTFKKQRCINGNIYILSAPIVNHNTYRQESSSTISTTLPTAFSSFFDLPILYTEASIQTFLAMDNKEDTLTQSQMLKTTDNEAFIAAQIPEIRGLEKMNVFDYKDIQTLPPRARLLSSIWSYRRKRRPNGDLIKHKARLCVDGSQQQHGRDYWETYAPVVSWSTVRLILLLSTILGLKSRQVDYTQAFPQADLDDPVYMRLPQGWFLSKNGTLQPHPDPKHNDTSHYIKLRKNLYGCKQAARNWFQHLNQGLLAEGFIQSKIDPCLYLRSDCIMVVYTDDCLIFSPDNHIIDSLLKNLSTTYLLEDQGNVQDYLGIHICKDQMSKTITMTQTGLIESIIKDLGLNNTSNTKTTPSDSILYPDTNGLPRQETWNYRSIIGKLNFLAQNTRPDISFAVHQCARFCTKPTALHELAVKRIARYLLYTKDKGLILHPTKDFNLDMYVDADFAGMWHQQHSALRENVLSRTGYIITFCGCPIHWVSKLQSEIALSTTESEYIALSMGTRELLPIRRLLQEIHQQTIIKLPLPIQFNTTKTSSLAATQVFEDNASCIVLAHSESTKMRTKHIALKWHHFKDQIRQGFIKVVKIDTNYNWADILTKPLGRQKHEALRKMIMGW